MQQGWCLSWGDHTGSGSFWPLLLLLLLILFAFGGVNFALEESAVPLRRVYSESVAMETVNTKESKNPRSHHLSLETESELLRSLYAVKLAGCHPQKSGCEKKSHPKFSNLITSPCPQNLKLCQVKETWGEPSPCSFWLQWAHSRSILRAGRLRPSIQPECSPETGWKRGGR